jgi:type II secretory pathway predicted ATPase ExeA
MNSKEMLSYFGLTALPFSKEIPTEQLHLLPSVEKHLAAAQLLVDTHGIGVILGKSGTGNYAKLSLM